MLSPLLQWYEKTWEMVLLVIIFTDFCVVFLYFVFLFDIFHLFIDSAFRLICSLPLSLSYHWWFLQIIACHLSFLSVGLKFSVQFGIINNTTNVRFGFSLSWFKGPCCECLIWKILYYVILYCGRLIGRFLWNETW